ncbi:hypothetical protein D6833_11615 [Candidatus Parcubacteria bacterium]|nr:MAG: hypothetical protein D6833_11615 [Candidatus Parcubacteria bacterium]
MSTVRVHLSKKVWQELVLLGQKEQASPGNLLEQAVRRFLQEKGARLEPRRGLQESFGVWKERDDLQTESAVIVSELRREWDEREQRLGLA